MRPLRPGPSTPATHPITHSHHHQEEQCFSLTRAGSLACTA